MTRTPTRPIIRYFGGKWRLAPWIISHFPEHTLYAEPYGGAASVLLRKPPSKIEVWNDLNGELVNLFRILQSREQSRDLLRRLRFTLWSREEQRGAFSETNDPVERARRLVVRHWMDIKGSRISGFRVDISGKTGVSPGCAWQGHLLQFSTYISRIKSVVIEHEPATDMILRYDRPGTLFYVDPPYVTDTRRMKDMYHTEMTDDGHRELAEVLHSVKGHVILSGYDCDLCRELYEDWHLESRKSQVNGGASKTETLWLNPRAAEKQKQLKLFDHA